KMSAGTRSLTADEIAVRGADGTAASRYDFAIGRDAHGAAGLTPMEAGRSKDAVQPFRLCCELDLDRTRDDPCLHRRSDVTSADDTGRVAQVRQARVRARADEHPINRDTT